MDYITNLIAAIETRELKIPEGAAVIPIVLFALMMLGLLFGSVMGWISILIAKINKFPLPIRDESHTPPPWGGLDVLLAFGLWTMLPLLGYLTLRLTNAIPTPNPKAPEPLSLWAVSIIQTVCLLTVLITTVWLFAWFKSQSQQAGWSRRYIIYDVLLGAVVFILSMPVLYALMALASFATKQEYNHPLIDAINKEPSGAAMAFWVAVICAPFIEEFVFRVMLQGYLQSLAEKSSLSKLWIALIGRGRIEGETMLSLESGLIEQAPTAQVTTAPSDTLQPIANANPYAPSSVIDAQQHFGQAAPQTHQPDALAQVWPIAISGTLFGLAHYGYGASWIPLIFFGCVLGWLYQKTNRIWPSLAAHMFCNFLGTTSILMQTLVGPPT